jgi:hypothetical protein
MKGEERRRYIRIFLPGGQVRVISGPLLALVGRVIDVSIGGLKFCADSDFSEGEKIEMELTLPTGIKFKCISTIVSFEKVDAYGKKIVYMAKFVQMTEKDKEMLGDFIMKIKNEQDSLWWK